MTEQKMTLPLEAIEFSVLARHNPREFDSEHAVTLARSMNAEGIQTPFVVFPAEIIAESGLVFEGFHTESAYVAATGWHRQWGLRLTAAELAARDIEPDKLPLSEVPCEIIHGTFSEFWAKLFTDNTRFVPGMNSQMGKMPTRDEIRRIFENLCLLPSYLELSTAALSGLFKMARGTADAWRAKVVEGILDAANPYQLTPAYREELCAVIASGERVGLDGKRRKAQVHQEKRSPASPEPAPEPEPAETPPEDELSKVRGAVFAVIGEVKTAFDAHALSVSDQMDFETFCDECSHQFVQTPNVLQSLVLDSEAPNAPDSEANAIARGLDVKALQKWQGILVAIHAALQTDAQWIETLRVTPLDEAVSAFRGGYARLTKRVTGAVQRWHPSEPVPAIQPLVDTLIIDIGCQSLFVAMDDGDARSAIGDTVVSQFQEGTATLRAYSECFQSDKLIIQKPAADVLRHTVLKAYRQIEVLERFAVTEMSALGAGLRKCLERSVPNGALSVEERLSEFSQWNADVNTQEAIERANRVKAYSETYDAFQQAYHVSGEARQHLLDLFNPPLTDKPEDQRPVPTFEQLIEACQVIPGVWFADRLPNDTGDAQFFLNLEATTKVFETLTSALTESDAATRESLLMHPRWGDFFDKLESFPDADGLLQELNERFKPGAPVFRRDAFSSGSAEGYRWQRKYLLTRAEIDEVLDDFYREVIEPRASHAEAVAAHESAYDAARETAIAGIGEFPGEVSWRDVLQAAGQHLDSALHAEMPRTPDREAVDVSTVRHQTHLLHLVKKGIETGTSWFQHLLKSKAPAPEPATPTQPHYADPSDKHALSFEELCAAVEEELGILIETYPSELAAFHIPVERVEDLRDVLSEVGQTL